MLNRKSLLTTLLSVGLTACSVGPHYKQPTLALPQQFSNPNTAAVDVSPNADASDPEFWHSFHDPELISLVQRALTANNDLHAALAHYDSANALLRQAKFDRYPTVTRARAWEDRRSAISRPLAIRGIAAFSTQRSMQVGSSISLGAFVTA